MFYHKLEGIDRNNLQINTKDKIENFILESKYDEAIKLGQSYLDSLNDKSAQENILFLHTFAKAYYENRQFDQALNIINLIPSEINDSDVMSLKSIIYSRLGRYKEAIEVSNKAITLFPEEKIHHIIREEAAKYLPNYIDKTSDFYYHVDDFMDATKTDNPFYILDKAIESRLLKQFDDGIEYSKLLIKNAPLFNGGYVNLAINYSLRHFSSNNESNLHSDNNFYELAMKALDDALKLNSKDSISLYYKALLLESVGQNEEAISLYKTAIEISTKYANPIFSLSKLEIEIDDNLLFQNSLIHAYNGNFEASLSAISQILDHANNQICDETSSAKNSSETKKLELLKEIKELIQAASDLKGIIEPYEMISNIGNHITSKSGINNLSFHLQDPFTNLTSPVKIITVYSKDLEYLNIVTNSELQSISLSSPRSLESEFEEIENESLSERSICKTLTKAESCLKTTLELVADNTASPEAIGTEITNLRAMVNETNQENVKLRQKLEILKDSMDNVKSEMIKILSLEADRLDHQHNIELIQKNIILKQYYSGFLKAAQKFCIGGLAAASGEVAESSVLGDAPLVFLPPFIYEGITLFRAVGDYILKTQKANKITTALNSFPDPLHFAQDLVPKIAAKIALSEGKVDRINSSIDDHSKGITNKIFNYIEGFKELIWVNENPTPAMKIGAHDAIKLIAEMKAGLIQTDNLDDKELIKQVLLIFITEETVEEFMQTNNEDYEDNIITISSKGSVKITHTEGRLAIVPDTKCSSQVMPKNCQTCSDAQCTLSQSTRNNQEIHNTNKHWYDCITYVLFSCCSKGEQFSHVIDPANLEINRGLVGTANSTNSTYIDLGSVYSVDAISG